MFRTNMEWSASVVFITFLLHPGKPLDQYFGRPSFESRWYSVVAQNPHPLVIYHNLNEFPVKVDVQVKVRNNGEDYIFTGVGTAQADDDLSGVPFGGVVYRYNQEEVVISVPLQNNGPGAGGIAYTGLPSLYKGSPVVQGPYYQASVRVRVWLSRDMPPLLMNVTSYISSTDNYKEIVHGLGFYPDIISAQLLFDDGYIAEVQGAVMNSNNANSLSFDLCGTVYGYNDQLLRFWSSPMGVYGAADGWTPGKYYRQATIRVMAWNVNVLQKVYESSFPVGKGVSYDDKVSFPRKYDTSNYFVSVQVRVSDNTGSDFIFQAVGTTMAYGFSNFGGMVYVYTNTDVYLYLPNTGLGHVIYVGGWWGSGSQSMSCDTGVVNITLYYLSDNCFSYSPDSSGCVPELTDLLFVIDTSESETNQTTSVKQFMYDVIDTITLGINAFQVGLLTYSLKPVVHFNFTEHNKVSIQSSIEQIDDGFGATFTAPALQLAKSILLDCDSGSRGNGILQYIVLMSDGLSSDHEAAIETADDIRDIGGRIITLGIGDFINHSELIKISGHAKYVFCPNNVNMFYNTILKDGQHHSCTECSSYFDTDVVILFDTNSNQTQSDFYLRQMAIGKLISKININNTGVRVSLFQYSDEPDSVFSFLTPSEKDFMISSIHSLSRDKTNTLANTSHALNHVYNYGFDATSGARFKARKSVVIISDAYWTDTDHSKSVIEDMYKNSITVFDVDAGTNSNYKEFQKILVDSCHLFFVDQDDFSAMDVLVSMMTLLIKCK